MAHPFYFSCYTKVLVFSLLLFLFLSLCSTSYSKPQLVSTRTSTRVSSRRILEVEEEEQQDEKPLKKKTTTTQSTKNQTKLIKPNTTPSSKNQTKITKSSNLSTKNQTKTIKSNNTISLKNQTKSNATSTKTIKSNNLSPKNQTKQLKVSSKESPKTTPTDTGLKKKLNSTTSASTPKSKKLNSTSKATTPVSTSSKKSLDLVKASNKTTKATATATDKQTKSKTTTQPHDATKQQSKKPAKQAPPGWFIDEEEDDDMVSISEFRDLPNKFQRTLIPDLERITTTSKAYLTKANDEITKGFKPYVGNKYAPTVAAVASCAFILIPLLLVSLLCTRIKAFFSLQKILIFIQVYLSIYFTILCVSSLVTGIEPLKFLYSVSHSTYLCLQVLQTLAYVFYLLLLLMFLVLVFSTECGLGLKFLGLAQVFVGFAVGLHYYVTVFHRVVLRQPPKTSWKVHGIYATCFLLICVLAGADNRRKKAYVENDGEEGKKN